MTKYRDMTEEQRCAHVLAKWQEKKVWDILKYDAEIDLALDVAINRLRGWSPDDRSEEMIGWMKERRDLSAPRAKDDLYDGTVVQIVDEFIEEFNKPKEQHMTLAEIARDWREGDLFTVGEWNDMTFDSRDKKLRWARSGGIVGITREEVVSKGWRFTYHPGRCPHCGKGIDES